MTVVVGILNKQGFRRGTEFNDYIPHDSIGKKRPGQARALSEASTPVLSEAEASIPVLSLSLNLNLSLNLMERSDIPPPKI